MSDYEDLIPIRINDIRLFDLVLPCDIDNPVVVVKKDNKFIYIHFKKILEKIEYICLREDLKRNKEK